MTIDSSPSTRPLRGQSASLCSAFDKFEEYFRNQQSLLMMVMMVMLMITSPQPDQRDALQALAEWRHRH